MVRWNTATSGSRRRRERFQSADDLTCAAMFGSKKNKEEHRYYLLPGMGRSNREHRQRMLRWAILVGILVSAAVAGLLYVLNRRI